jgi:glutathione peroxidase
MRATLKALSLAVLAAAIPAMSRADSQSQTTRNAFDFSFVSIDGKPMPLSAYRGHVLLVVNTASFCGFTPQYKALQAIYDEYAPRGLVVIGVPSNDFGGQEPKAAGEIKKFCEGAFGITFPLTDKAVVKGDGAHPFYRWARDTLGAVNAPWWNFHKYLVGRDGRLVTAFLSTTVPDAGRVKAAIETELAKPAPAPTQ